MPPEPMQQGTNQSSASQASEFEAGIQAEGADALSEGRNKALEHLKGKRTRATSKVSLKPTKADEGKAFKAERPEETDNDPDFDDPDVEEEKPKTKEKPKAEGDQTAPDAEKLTQAKAKLDAALEGLSDSEIEQILGATNDAFAALTGKTQSLRRKQEVLNADKAAFQAERSEFGGIKSEFDDLLIEAKSNPRKCLETFGWSIEDAVSYEATDGEEPLDRRLKRFEGSLSEKVEAQLKKLEEEKEHVATKSRELAVRDYEGTVKAAVIAANREEHPLVFRYDEAEVVEAVKQVQNTAWLESGKTKTVAASKVLRYLESRLQQQLEKLTGSKELPPARNGSRQRENGEAEERPVHLSNRDASERTDEDDAEEYGTPGWREGALRILKRA